MHSCPHFYNGPDRDRESGGSAGGCGVDGMYILPCSLCISAQADLEDEQLCGWTGILLNPLSSKVGNGNERSRNGTENRKPYKKI